MNQFFKNCMNPSVRQRQYKKTKAGRAFFLVLVFFLVCFSNGFALDKKPVLHYTVSLLQPSGHTYDVELACHNWEHDSVHLKMPSWMPGYYQLMNYANSVENISAKDEQGKSLAISKMNENTWVVSGIKNKPFFVKYTVRTKRQFVADSYVDSAHAYIIPENSFLYIEDHLDVPVSVSLVMMKKWKNIATGLDPVKGMSNEFTADNFDILYDCPILAGNLTELPSFKIHGIEHRFIGYKIGDFDQKIFMQNLKKITEAGINIIGDIPYKEYTFIGIGPGRGGIEHLDNSTISFDGSGLNKPAEMMRMMNFIAHEYFHNYNVKRIRPFELGPFDYDKGSRTNQLWISEGLTVYYEYLIVKRAGLSDTNTLFSDFDANLNAVENNPGRLVQSLQEASYDTWSDGPFGMQGKEPGQTISYYDKGPLVGMLLDFAIRNATQNEKSLDDVMRLLYWKYYKKKNRGFTAAEFQSACEEVAGTSLTEIFEYVYTTKEPDYDKYLAYAGLKMDKTNNETDGKPTGWKFTISMMANPTLLQKTILKSWLGE